MKADGYDAHLSEFTRWRGDRALSEDLLFGWIRHCRDKYRRTTAAVKWYAVKWLLCDSGRGDWDQETAVKSCAWVERLAGQFGRDGVETRRLSDSECKAVFDAATRRQRGFILAIRSGDLRVTEMISLRPHDQSLPRPVWVYLRLVFAGNEWLVETGRGRPYHRSYISNQLAKLSKRVLGKAYRAEAFRPPANSLRERALMDGEEFNNGAA